MNAKRKIAGVLLGILLAGCGEAQTGVDEHGNALGARIRVVSADGTPKAGAEVVVRPDDWIPGQSIDTISGAREGSRMRTDERGECSLNGFRAGSYALRVGDSLFAGEVRFELSAGLEIRTTVEPVGSVTGRIPSAVAGTLVSVPGLEQASRVDSSGRFVLAFLPGGFHRIRVGAGEGGTQVSGIEIVPGRLTDLGEIPFDPTRTLRVESRGVLADRILPPLVDPEGGTFRDRVHVRAWSVVPTDSLFVSQDGSAWAPWTERTLESSACLQLKSTRSSATYFPIRSVCYTIIR